MDQHESEEREHYIAKIRAAEQPLEAVFLLGYYNSCRRGFAPDLSKIPRLELSEVLPGLSHSAYEQCLPLIQRMWRDANAVALAYFKYPEAKRPYEKELAAFKTNNPGFSEEAYELARHACLVKLR